MGKLAALLGLALLGGGCSAVLGDPAESGAPGSDASLSVPLPDGGGVGGCSLPAEAPRGKVYFTGAGAVADTALERQLVAMIDATPVGERIRGSMYRWERVEVADALAAAAARGVDVRMIVDEVSQHEEPAGSGSWVWNEPVLRIQEALGATGVILCDSDSPPDRGACIGDATGINHNKFFVFSALCDGSTDVVAYSSADLDSSSLTGHDSLVVLRDAPALFDRLESYWSDLAARVPDPDYYREEDADGARVYFFPRAGTAPDSDPVDLLLRTDVDCSAGGSVRVAMSSWSAGRGYLAASLAALRTAGCDVRVLSRTAGTSAAMTTELAATLGTDARQVDGLHHRFLLIDATYLGVRRALVWTGSHNFTGPSLRNNDETLVRLEDTGVVQAFAGKFDAMWGSL